MHVTIRLFASHREAAGRNSYVADVPDGCSIADVYTHVCERFPAIAQTGAAVAFALNQTHASGETRVTDGDEIALLPPVAGG